MADSGEKAAAPEIARPASPVMVTPLQQLQTKPAWIDCTFCERMAKTSVREQVDEESPSGYVQVSYCFICKTV